MTFDRPSLLSSKTGEHSFNVPKILYQNRYCDQDDFSVLVCGGGTKCKGNVKSLNEVYELKGPKFECSKFPNIVEARYRCKTAIINSDIVVVGGFNNGRNLYSVELFNNNIKTWFFKTEFSEKRTNFSICTFKQNLYIIGGIYEYYERQKSCLAYDMKRDRWSQIADMNEKRYLAACTVYEGKIVVSGGLSHK